MARTKKTAETIEAAVKQTETADTVKAEAATTVEEKKAPAKKTPAKKTTTAKKTVAKKTASKTTTAKKTDVKKVTSIENVFIQQNGAEVTAADLIAKAKKHADVKDPAKVDVYVRPEINMVYYVIDGEKFGNFELC